MENTTKKEKEKEKEKNQEQNRIKSGFSFLVVSFFFVTGTFGGLTFWVLGKTLDP